ncbi:hypothetical protein ALO45_200117 [Pseudomonas syringae pv. syringae]|nr:hypothetical protein ALO45_200117 [Pseudomonas syringae pv. syringae]
MKMRGHGLIPKQHRRKPKRWQKSTAGLLTILNGSRLIAQWGTCGIKDRSSSSLSGFDCPMPLTSTRPGAVHLRLPHVVRTERGEMG